MIAVRLIESNGELDFHVGDIERVSIFSNAESLDALNVPLDAIAHAVDVPAGDISRLFLSPRNPIEERAWENLGAAVTEIRRRWPRVIVFQRIVDAWHTWLLQRPEIMNLGSAQRFEPARESYEWIQELTR